MRQNGSSTSSRITPSQRTERSRDAELTAFVDERGPVRDALWYCDGTTSPDGDELTAEARIAETKARYGPDHLVTRFITGATPDLLAAVERTKRRLNARSTSAGF